MGVLIFYLQLKYKSERLHHDFLGVALQMFTLRPIQILGMLYTLDHILLVYAPLRNSFDFADLMVNTRMYVVPLLFFYCGIELMTKILRYAIRNKNRLPPYDTEDETIDTQGFEPNGYPEYPEYPEYTPLSQEEEGIV